MGKKYIVEIGRLERLYKAFVNGNGKPNMTWLSPEVDLTPYTEPDLHEVRKKAYEKGYHDAAYNCHEGCNFLEDAKKKADEEYRRGYADCEAHYKAMVQDSDTTEGADAYQRGLADAWEAARKICTNWVLSDSVLSEIFGMDKTIDDIMKESTAFEAIEKIRAYEQEKEEQIQVGDEVATDAGNRASVLYENPDGTQVFVFKSDGTAAWWTKSALHRTGRNFFEIATVLKKMQGEQDG